MAQDLYIPQQKTFDIEFIDKDDPEGTPFKAKGRADLTFGERNQLVFPSGDETTMDEVHAILAPFVPSWNVGRLDAKGKPEAVPAPSVGGAESFQSVPNAFFWLLWSEIRNHATQRLDPTPPASADTSDESSDDTATDET